MIRLVPGGHRGQRRVLGMAVALAMSALVLSACSSGNQSATPSTSPTGGVTTPSSASGTTPGSSGSVNTVAIKVAVANDNVSPAPTKIPVPLGSRVVLTVTSDVADEVHVHGYELEKPVKAGGSATFDFIADQAGVFPVETHTSEKLLLQLQVS